MIHKMITMIYIATGCLTLMSPASIAADFETARIPFIANEGQQPSTVAYYARTFGATIFIMSDSHLVYSLAGQFGAQHGTGTAFEEVFIGGRNTSFQGGQVTTTKINSFTGPDQSRWRSEIDACNVLSINSLYPGINLELIAHGNSVEKVFHVGAGVDPNQIEIGISGIQSLAITPAGELAVITAAGEARFSRPVAWQQLPTGRTEINIAYRLRQFDGSSMQKYNFELGEYDRSYPLIIDPLLASTFLGGNSDEINFGPFITCDDEGDIYLSGFTSSADFPLSADAFQPAYGGGSLDFFIARFSNDLSILKAATFLGGSGFETECTIALGPDNTIYAGGYTNSTDFPTTTGAFDETANGAHEMVIVKLDRELTTLISATYLGGSGNEGWFNNRMNLIVEPGGDLLLVGHSASTDFPVTPGAYDETFNGSGPIGSGDFVVVRLDGDLSTVKAATYYGGASDEYASSLCLDNTGRIYVNGATISGNLPTTSGSYDQFANGGGDAFIARFSNDLSILQAATIFGGTQLDEPFDLEIGESGDLYLSGLTHSWNLPLHGIPFDTSFNGGEDSFVARFTEDLDACIASTFLGGSGNDNIEAATLSPSGSIYVTGRTLSGDFPIVTGTYDDTYNGGTEHGDIFITGLSPTLSHLEASTFLGGTNDEKPFGILFDPAGYLIIGGFTHSVNYPVTHGAFDQIFNGYRDVIVTRLGIPGVSAVDEVWHDPLAEEDHFSVHCGSNRIESLVCTPNPMQTGATISFQLGGGNALIDDDKSGFVTLLVCDMNGRVVNRLYEKDTADGVHRIQWRGIDRAGDKVPAGVYFCTLTAGTQTLSKKVMVVR